MTRSDRRWQVALLALCALCGLLFAMDITSGTLTASEGLDFRIEASGTPYVGRIEGVSNGSRAESASLRDGDMVPFAKLGPEDRYRLLSGVYSYERLTIVLMRGGRPHTITYTSGPGVPQTRWDLVLGDAAFVWMLCFAVLLAWRRPELPEARALSAFLAVNSLFGNIGAGNWASQRLSFDIGLCMAGYLAQGLAPALLAYYAGLFAAPSSRFRRILIAASYASAAAGILGAAYVLLGSTYGFVDPFAAHKWVHLAVAASWLFPFSALIATVAVVRGAERGRVGWTTLSLTPLLLANIPYSFTSAVLSTSILGYTLWIQIINVTSFFAPLGMSYALLNRRLLDLGFALNRAAVYTGVSVVVVGTFMLVEFALSELLGAGRNANIIAGSILALLLGFSMRYIHARVDHLLDNIFFKKRHEDERAIRDFAHEVAYISDEPVILERTKRLLERSADASWVRIELLDARGYYGDADENDPAIVSLRAWHRPVDLHATQSALRGEFAYPMVARGRLAGVLVIGPKRSAEPYAPDESDAIAHLAHGAGLALDALSLRSAEGKDVFEAICESNDRVIAAIAQLKASIERSTSSYPAEWHRR
ncbi:MAG: GAF domain-containing protein [Candidatus Eremiobacteraeota bacterium]|nr:GAF domain-containing protein [Candidatus Eremiobacteraeota bacterium]